MRVLVVHNRYQLPGGEERVVESEIAMLESHGHDVKLLEELSSDIKRPIEKIKAAFGFIFSISTYRKIVEAIDDFNPNVVHVHNYFPLVSPSVFYACKYKSVPVVHTLHNYRSICPTGLLFHEGRIDETSIRGNPFFWVRYKVYRNSGIATFILALSIFLHRFLGTWTTKVDRFIALTEFQKEKYILAGWPERKIVVKPNFCDNLPDDLDSNANTGRYAIFVGRLSHEKGLDTILEAWTKINFPLKIVGEGPLEDELLKKGPRNVDFLGKKSQASVYKLMSDADFLIVSSKCYEAFGLVVVEAFSCGTPVIAPALGGLPELVRDGANGLLYRPGDSVDLAACIQRMVDEPELRTKMSEIARRDSLEKYSEPVNYAVLMSIYNDLTQHAH